MAILVYNKIFLTWNSSFYIVGHIHDLYKCFRCIYMILEFKFNCTGKFSFSSDIGHSNWEGSEHCTLEL